MAVALASLLLVPACSSGEQATGGRASVLVTRRVVPRGAQVQALTNGGALVTDVVPADLAGDDAITDTADVRCLVLAVDLPQGTVLRRRHLAEPAALGIDAGIALDGSAVTCG